VDAFLFLLVPFVACLVLMGIHAYLGIHVLARGVIFVDIALAQIAALGTTVAYLSGHQMDSYAAYFISLGFTFLGASVFALSRNLRERVPQEAIIGITYAVAAAATILFIDQAQVGSEKIKDLLVGNILWVSKTHVAFIAVIYSLIGAFHYVFRKRFLALSFDHDAPESKTFSAMMWDLAFYMSFGFVITSAVQIAGVLLVFSFLIVPAVFAAMFTDRLPARLAVGWLLGFVVSAAGITASYKLDLPTGAAVVATFGIALLLGIVVRLAVPKRDAMRKAGA
jgi:zinc/manganese transport system permease protein